jgi:hypothetical protein
MIALFASLISLVAWYRLKKACVGGILIGKDQRVKLYIFIFERLDV